MTLLNLSPTSCKNCYKCVRQCSVKAIKIIDDQAQIIEDKCIGCGDCFVVCPQNARNIQSDIPKIKEALRNNKKVIGTLAPTFASIYKHPNNLFGILKALGFSHIEETARGAEIVSSLYKDYISNSIHQNMITSCCPSINLLIERLFPKLIDNLLPYESPMIVHSKLLKKEHEDCFVVFVGPCISKKYEVQSYQDENVIDAVLTFEELNLWMEEENLKIDDINYKDDIVNSSITGVQYPMDGGIIKGLEDHLHANDYTPLQVSGLDDCISLFKALSDDQLQNVFIEANSCRGGCIGGPAISHCPVNVFVNKLNLKHFIANCKNKKTSPIKCYPDLNFTKKFYSKKTIVSHPTEEDITSILHKMGKLTLEDELNCSACGYNTCRDKAHAVFDGMSQIEMCIPYMRNKAERLTNVIFENSPNIIFLLDKDLIIKEINPSAKIAFEITNDNFIGKHISSLIDPEDFEFVKNSKQDILNKKVTYLKYNLIVNENIVYLEEQNIIMAVFHNLSLIEKQNKQLALLKQNTLEAADNVINKQMRVAQEIASLLGETTAETKLTLSKLKKVVLSEDGDLK